MLNIISYDQKVEKAINVIKRVMQDVKKDPTST